MKTSMKIALAAAAGSALVLATPLAASAHVTVTPSGTDAGSYSVLTFAIPHGCEASATTSIRITVPDEVASVTPTVNPGWDVSLTRAGDRVATVTYTAHTPLPHELRDTFELSVRLPDGKLGDELAFPVLQTCVEGSVDWAETGGHDASFPAPTVVLTESTGGGHGHDTSHGTASSSIETADVLARGFGIGGLVVGAVGIVVAAASLRRSRSTAPEVSER